MKNKKLVNSIMSLLIFAVISGLIILLYAGNGNLYLTITLAVCDIVLAAILLLTRHRNSELSGALIFLITFTLFFFGMFMGNNTGRMASDTPDSLMHRGLMWGLALAGLYLLSVNLYAAILDMLSKKDK